MIWLANGDRMVSAALGAISAAGAVRGIHVSPVSAWEIGLLGRAKPGRTSMLRFSPDPKAWFTRFLGGPGIVQAALTADIAIDASYLPGSLHGDPGDRLIVATARHLGVPVVTRDRRIIAYARAGFVTIVPC